MADQEWDTIADRAANGLCVEHGDMVLVRDGAGRPDVLAAMLLALERRGATPLIESLGADHLRGLLGTVAPEYLLHWDRNRGRLMEHVHRVLVLGGAIVPQDAPPAALAAWDAAKKRLKHMEDARQLPILVLAVPCEARAAQLSCSLAALEHAVLPGLRTEVETLQAAIEVMMARVQGATMLTVRSGKECVLRARVDGRIWLDDDGTITATDRACGGVVSNLPAGSVYTTVLEEATDGTIWLPQAAMARGVTLTFQQGRVTHIEAEDGAEQLTALLDAHTGEPRRVSHIGVGLNPDLPTPVGWVLVDEHVAGSVFLALGENRYMGGSNASSLNIDFCTSHASLLMDDRKVVTQGIIEPQDQD